MVSHDLAVLFGDVVEQGDDISTADVSNRSRSKGRVNQPLKDGPPPFQASELFALAPQIFFRNALQCIGCPRRSCSPFLQWIAAGRDLTKQLSSLTARLVEREHELIVMRQLVPSARYCTTHDRAPLA